MPEKLRISHAGGCRQSSLYQKRQSSAHSEIPHLLIGACNDFSMDGIVKQVVCNSCQKAKQDTANHEGGCHPMRLERRYPLGARARFGSGAGGGAGAGAGAGAGFEVGAQRGNHSAGGVRADRSSAKGTLGETKEMSIITMASVSELSTADQAGEST